MQETSHAHLHASVIPSCWPLSSLESGMLPGSAIINNLKRKLDILQGSGHESACWSVCGFGELGVDWVGKSADHVTVLLNL